MSNSNMSLLNQYNNIDARFNLLFEDKYVTHNKFVQFIYYGYMRTYDGPHSEDSRYVLVDTNKQTWEFAKSIKDVKEFLGLGENGFTGLIEDISDLIKEEEELKSQLKQNSISNDMDYSRKLRIALL